MIGTNVLTSLVRRKVSGTSVLTSLVRRKVSGTSVFIIVW